MAAVSHTPAHSFKWDCKQFKPVAANFTVEECRPLLRCFSARLLKKTWKYFLFLFTWQQLSDNGSYVCVQCSPIFFLPNVARSLRQKNAASKCLRFQSLGFEVSEPIQMPLTFHTIRLFTVSLPSLISCSDISDVIHDTGTPCKSWMISFELAFLL